MWSVISKLELQDGGNMLLWNEKPLEQVHYLPTTWLLDYYYPPYNLPTPSPLSPYYLPYYLTTTPYIILPPLFTMLLFPYYISTTSILSHYYLHTISLLPPYYLPTTSILSVLHNSVSPPFPLHNLLTLHHEPHTLH